jgi:seryl-tRNA synthetase
MAQIPEGKELEQLERFRRSIAQAGPRPGRADQALRSQEAYQESWVPRNAASALDRVRQAAEAVRLTEQQNQEMEARGQELANRVAEELALAAERVRTAEARAQAAEMRAAEAEARVAEIQNWLDSVHDLILEEFGPSLGYAERGEPEAERALAPPRLQSS